MCKECLISLNLYRVIHVDSFSICRFGIPSKELKSITNWNRKWPVQSSCCDGFAIAIYYTSSRIKKHTMFLNTFVFVVWSHKVI